MRHPVIGTRADRRQVALWLSEEEWLALDAMARSRDWSRGESLAWLLVGLGQEALAEAVAASVPRGRRKGWAKPLRQDYAPACRHGRVRLAVWLEERLARRVLEALRTDRRLKRTLASGR